MDTSIRLGDALKLMNNGEAFNLEVVSFDQKRKTGGRLLKLDCESMKNPFGEKQDPGIEPQPRRNHWENITRTVYPRGSHPVTIHLFLITAINGMPVTLY